MTHIFVCKIKILGFPFAVLSEELAKQWVEKDPEMHYYDIVPIYASIE